MTRRELIIAGVLNVAIQIMGFMHVPGYFFAGMIGLACGTLLSIVVYEAIYYWHFERDGGAE